MVRTIIFSNGFLLAKNQVLSVLIGCNRQLLLIKIYAEISNIFKKVHHLLKLRASSKGIKQMLFLLFLNFFSNVLCMDIIPISDTVIFNSIFFNSAMFCAYFQQCEWFNATKECALEKAYEVVSDSDIVSKDAASNTGRKNWQTVRPGKIYWNPGDSWRHWESWKVRILDTSF